MGSSSGRAASGRDPERNARVCQSHRMRSLVRTAKSPRPFATRRPVACSSCSCPRPLPLFLAPTPLPPRACPTTTEDAPALRASSPAGIPTSHHPRRLRRRTPRRLARWILGCVASYVEIWHPFRHLFRRPSPSLPASPHTCAKGNHTHRSEACAIQTRPPRLRRLRLILRRRTQIRLQQRKLKSIIP